MAHKRINYPSVKLRGVYPESSLGEEQRSSDTAYNELGLNTNDLYNQSLGNWTEKVASSRAFVANLDLMDDIFASGQVSEDDRGRPIRIRFGLMDYFRNHGANGESGAPSVGQPAPGRKAYVSMFAEISEDGVITNMLTSGDNEEPYYVNGIETDLSPYISFQDTKILAQEAGHPNGTFSNNGNLMPNYFYAPHDLIFEEPFSKGSDNSYNGFRSFRCQDILHWTFGGTPHEIEEGEDFYVNNWRRYRIPADKVVKIGNPIGGQGFWGQREMAFKETPNAYVKPFREDYQEGILDPINVDEDQEDPLIVEFSSDENRISRNIMIRKVYPSLISSFNESNLGTSKVQQLEEMVEGDRLFEIIFPRTFFIKNPADPLQTLDSFLDYWGDSDGDGIPDIITMGPHSTQFFDVGIRQVMPYQGINHPKFTLTGESGFIRGRYDQVAQMTQPENPNLKAPDITDEGPLKPSVDSVAGGVVFEFPEYASQVKAYADFFTEESGLVETVYAQFLGFPRFRWETQLESNELYQEGEELDEQDFIVNVKSTIGEEKDLLYYRLDSQDYVDTSYPLKVKLNLDVFTEENVIQDIGVINGTGFIEEAGAGNANRLDGATATELYGVASGVSIDSELFDGMDTQWSLLSLFYIPTDLRTELFTNQTNLDDVSSFHYRYEVIQWGDESQLATNESIKNSFFFKPYEGEEPPPTTEFNFRKLINSQARKSVPFQQNSYHTYNRPGVYQIKVIAYRYSADGIYVLQTSLVTKNIVINDNNFKDQDFSIFGGTNFDFLPLTSPDSQAIIGGLSEQSNYHSAVTKMVKDDDFTNDDFLSRVSARDYVIQNSYKLYGEEPGQLDLSQVKLYNQPKDFWDIIKTPVPNIVYKRKRDNGDLVFDGLPGYFNLVSQTGYGAMSFLLNMADGTISNQFGTSPLPKDFEFPMEQIFIDKSEDDLIFYLDPNLNEQDVSRDLTGGDISGILVGDYKVEKTKNGPVVKTEQMDTPIVERNKDKQAF